MTGPVTEPEVRPTIEWEGGRFAVRERVSLLPLMKFATIARQQQAAGGASEGQREMQALAALYDLLQQCIDPAEWEAFYDHALTVGAGQEELMAAVSAAVQAASQFPTRRRSASPPGPPTIAANSAGGSSSPVSSPLDVQRMYEERGRADMAYAVLVAQDRAAT